eukprot:GHVU01211085.1.p1 GENE.GHVU01211085.1~~GHVU01211085.1.p1  ORF type:complete len:112 (+),score=3.06 GHVU01211085.1:158-493(+)
MIVKTMLRLLSARLPNIEIRGGGRARGDVDARTLSVDARRAPAALRLLYVSVCPSPSLFACLPIYISFYVSTIRIDPHRAARGIDPVGLGLSDCLGEFVIVNRVGQLSRPP